MNKHKKLFTVITYSLIIAFILSNILFSFYNMITVMADTDPSGGDIPSPNGTVYSCTAVSIAQTNGSGWSIGDPLWCWSGSYESSGNVSAIAKGTGQRIVFETWRDTGNGYYDENGFCWIGEYCMVACVAGPYGGEASTYGNVGDAVNFYFEDGTCLPCIIADAKNQSDAGCTKWGHQMGACVLEFEIEVSCYNNNISEGYGNGVHQTAATGEGQRVVKWENLGCAINGDFDFGAIQSGSIKSGIQDRSLLYSYINSVLHYPLNTGYILGSEEDDEEMNKKNVEVYKGLVKDIRGEGDDSEKYCLYELYGEDIHWYRYCGEASTLPGLGDHIWSAYDQNKLSDLVSFDTILYDSTNYLSCRVYENRPVVLSSEYLDLGYSDPRVLTIVKSTFAGYPYVVGSFEMTISKNLVAFITFLMGDKVLAETKKVIETIEGAKIWTVLQPLILILLGIAMIFFIMSLVGKVKNYVIGRNGSPKDFINRFIIGYICLGCLLMATYNPTKMNDTFYTAITLIDKMYEESLKKSLEDDDVIAVSDSDLVVQAAIWKTAIFEPWCKGQFNGKKYDQLYTTYAVLSDGKSAMKQSNDEVDTSDQTGKAYYNSAKYTGDVYVSIGGGKKVRNWAAYLYSCGSKYHIDYTINDLAEEKVKGSETEYKLNLNDEVYFPNANTTAYDSDIMADTFRVIDAQMNIAPQEYADGTVTANYNNSHTLKHKFMSQGFFMLINCALLLFLLPTIYGRFKNFVLLLVSMVQLIYYSILELFKENQIADFGKSIKNAFFGYFTNTMKMYIMITLYTKLVGNGLFLCIVYIILCIVVLGFNLQDVNTFKNNFRHAKHTAQMKIDNAKATVNNAKDKVSNIGKKS